MVGSGVDEDPTLIPGSALYSDVLMNVAQALQLTVTDHDGYSSGQKNQKEYNSNNCQVQAGSSIMQLWLLCSVC